MNAKAERHLAKAADYAAKGEEFYRKAGAEIVAAMEADPSLTQKQAGEQLGRSQQWVSEIVAAYHLDGTPAFQTKDTASQNRGATVRTLRKAETDELDSILADLPVTQTSAIAASAERVLRRPARTKLKDELPPASRFGVMFWRAVQDVALAHEELEKHGVASVGVEPNVRLAAEELARKSSEIAAAVVEAVVEASLKEEASR